MLCRLACLVHEGRAEWRYKPNKPMDTIKPPRFRAKVNPAQKFMAMDNVSNFIRWCAEIGVPCIFESNDLIELDRHPETETQVLNW